jgi:hypothetical protein
MPRASQPHNELVRDYPVSSHPALRQNYQAAATEKSMGRGRRIQIIIPLEQFIDEFVPVAADDRGVENLFCSLRKAALDFPDRLDIDEAAFFRVIHRNRWHRSLRSYAGTEAIVRKTINADDRWIITVLLMSSHALGCEKAQSILPLTSKTRSVNASTR